MLDKKKKGMAIQAASSAPVLESQDIVKLDEDIASIRAEIRDLTQKRRLISSSLLASDRFSKPFSDLSQEDDAPILARSKKHAQSNLHRLAFSTTSFPYRDPADPSDSPRLLGVRIDICSRSGKFEKPYYVLLKRDAEDKKTLRVYRHTIPPFIPLKTLEQRYLPAARQDNDLDEEVPAKVRKQNLPSLVRKVRQHLVSWHLRREAIELLQDQLELTTTSKDAPEESRAMSVDSHQSERHGRLGVASLAATAVEARFARIEWTDGRVGQIKIADSGRMEKVVIYGENGREQDTERVLLGGGRRIDNLSTRLEALDTTAG